MYSRLCKLLKSQSFFLFGPRGSGKSTLLSEHFAKNQDHLWIDLLEQKLELKLSQDPDHLLELWKINKPKWIIIDEVQKIPALLDVVHRGIESHKILFALTGSSSRKLKRGHANLLAGRAASLYLHPFSALELGDSFQLEKALRLGLLPKYWAENMTEAEIVRSLYSYVSTYLKEEIAAEQLVRKLDPFRRFLVSAAQCNGKIINYAKIERDAGIAPSQAERHFEILHDTLIGRSLEPFHMSIRKRQTQKSKFYFFDTGALRALQNITSESLQNSTYEFGNLFETFLINEFFKLNDALEKHWNFSYLRTKDDVEIDLIIEKPRGKLILVEIKSSFKISRDETNSFLKISQYFKHAERYVLSNDHHTFKHENTLFLHWLDGLKQIFEIN